ncbi:MAG: replication protein [Caldisericum sp.]
MIPDGSTPIKNEILTEIFAKGRLSYNEMRIVSFIIRWSWGFDAGDRRQDWTKELSISEIAREIGMHRVDCSKLINKMIREKKLLKDGNKYQFNEHFEEWEETVGKNPHCRKKTYTTVGENPTPPVEKHLHPCRENTYTPDTAQPPITSELEGKKNSYKETSKETNYKEILKKHAYISHDSENSQISSLNEEGKIPPRVPPSPPVEDVKHVLDYWNACNIIRHKDTEKIRKKIRAALKVYTVEELEGAIRNYAYVLSNPQKFFWTHKWQLKDFLDRGVDRFLPTNFREEDFYIRRPKTKAELIREKNDAILAKLYWEAEQKEKNKEDTNDTERDDINPKNAF